MTLQTLRLSDGQQISYLELGQGEPLVLLHGVGMCAEAWGPQIAHFAKTNRVIALDMPGHGLSDLLPGAPELARLCGLGGQNFAAVGLQLCQCGGAFDGRADRRRVWRWIIPIWCCGLAVLNGVYRRTPEARAAVQARAAALAEGANDIDVPLTRWFSDSAADQAVRAQVAGWLKTVNLHGYAAAYRAFANGDMAYAEAWPQIQSPALVLTASGDANSTPEMAKAMAKAAPMGQAVVIEGHRHMVNLTAPAQVNAALAALAGRAAVRRKKRDTRMTLENRRLLRDAFGTFMTGVTVVTTLDEAGAPIGFTANSFSSVSLDPPLLLVSIAKTSGNYARFMAAKGFAINILAEGQKDVSNTFAKPVEDRFSDRALAAWPAWRAHVGRGFGLV